VERLEELGKELETGRGGAAVDAAQDWGQVQDEKIRRMLMFRRLRFGVAHSSLV
jgi:hypothetical protein